MRRKLTTPQQRNLYMDQRIPQVIEMFFDFPHGLTQLDIWTTLDLGRHFNLSPQTMNMLVKKVEKLGYSILENDGFYSISIPKKPKTATNGTLLRFAQTNGIGGSWMEPEPERSPYVSRY